jgi:ABC-type uncharacterized transport system involved in gliding motility auxiliary subunit
MKKYLQKLDTVGLLLLVAAAMLYWVSNAWEGLKLGLLIAGAVFVVIGVSANYQQIIGSLGKRSTKYAGNYVLSVILVIAIVSVLNYIGQRHIKRFDTTGTQQFSLAPQTAKVLSNLKKDVNIKAFYPGGADDRLKELLVEFSTANRRIHYEFIDPDRYPDLAKQNDVTKYGVLQNPFTGSTIKLGTLIVFYGDRKEKIEKQSETVQEEDITNAIIKAGRSEAKKIYFIQGHGEKELADSDRSGLSAAKIALENQGYVTDTVNLATTGEKGVPADAKVLVEAGPTVDLYPEEIKHISSFLARGDVGMLVFVDPKAPSLEPLLTGWGIQVDNDVILDISDEGRMMGSNIPIVHAYQNHRITENFKLTTIFPFARSIRPAKTVPDGINVETLFMSSPESWGETDLKNKNAIFEASKDIKGPVSLAVAATKEISPSSDKRPAVKTRMVAVGTSEFPLNAVWKAGGNGNLFLNMISWLAQDEDLISIRPKSHEDRRILLSHGQLVALWLFTIIILPGIALFIGIAVVRNRRRK